MELTTPNANMLVDVCESRLTVHLALHNLLNMDTPVIGRSDPFAILFLDNTGTSIRSSSLQQSVYHASTDDASAPPSASPPNQQQQHRNIITNRNSVYPGRDTSRWQRVGVTETIRNVRDAVFTTAFEIPYFFERAQRIAVDVFDRDVHDNRGEDNLNLHDFLGSAECSVPSLVRAKHKKLVLPLIISRQPNLVCGDVTIAVEEVSQRKQRIHYNCVIEGLSKKHGLGPFLTISRKLTAGGDNWIPVLRSKSSFIQHGKKFLLNEMSHNYEKLCRCDDNIPLRFDISYEKMGKHHVAATGISTLAMVQQPPQGRIQLSRTTANGCCGGSTDPTLWLNNRTITQDVTFLDYIIGGCEISLVIAIDFTASNGDPSQRGSLHFCDSMEANEYETAIRSVGDILASYDTDQKFPVLGFGAKLPPDYSHPSHCFTITEDFIYPGNIIDNTCSTIDGVLNAYRHALYNIRLSGPTVFSDIVHAAADHARVEARDSEQSYTILLILTDGVINDVDPTLQALFQTSSLPVSIVIIGVGDADFTDMVVLDGDGMGRERDIVQFVNYRQFKNAPEILRSSVLEEIPTQFLQFMKQRNINPLPPPYDEDSDGGIGNGNEDDEDDDDDGDDVVVGGVSSSAAAVVVIDHEQE